MSRLDQEHDVVALARELGLRGDLLRQIEKSGTYPTDWERDIPRNRRPR